MEAGAALSLCCRAVKSLATIASLAAASLVTDGRAYRLKPVPRPSSSHPDIVSGADGNSDALGPGGTGACGSVHPLQGSPRLAPCRTKVRQAGRAL